jgi:ABC-2 type transport system ATP-binding protein
MYVVIEAKELTKAYDEITVVDIPHLEIRQGESLGLVGNNGAGKTTLFRMILDLIEPETGEVLSKGGNVRTVEAWKWYTGAYLDESFLIGFLSPEEYFEFVGGLHDLSREAVAEALEPLANFFNGEILGKGKFIRDLSRGNQQKVGIAAALLAEPEVLILDEPFSSLDPTTQIRLKNLLQELRATRSVTMLISSHNLNHVTEVCERITVLEDGCIVRDIQTSDSTLSDLEAYFTV